MTTPEMMRCKKCVYCVKEGSTWVCTEKEESTNVNNIPDEECPLEEEW